ncbi:MULTISPECIES: 6-phosphogluconolactonase [Hydrocarboniphaga]|uniref:6-phosphogluconolactonase n=1 Tax=Hydrocarboniphaga TaxID=243627 RepID=UPI00058C8DD1|nr:MULTISPECIES: 6-phosphogluconolactonase [Hydrocarboniphaga]MDZ4079725.1 6-phosphogluconolactonase [Hydrocarboniphaga sp.]
MAKDPLPTSRHSLQKHCCADDESIGVTAASVVAGILAQALDTRPLASLIVSGGRSPARFMESLSTAALDWSRVVIGLADERWVDPACAASNEHLVRTHLLRNAAARARFVPLKNASRSAAAGVGFAERAIAEIPRPFDAVVLGVGEDGHTASLFPCALETARALDPKRPANVAAINPETAPHERMTLTLGALLDSRQLIIIASGEKKREVLERAAASGDPLCFPIAAVLLQDAVPTHLFCDF